MPAEAEGTVFMGDRKGPCALGSNGWPESLSHKITQMVIGVRPPPNSKWSVGHLKLLGDTSGFQGTPICSENVHKKSHYPPMGAKLLVNACGASIPRDFCKCSR